MSSAPNVLFQYFPSTTDGRVCSTCQAPFGPKTGNSTMRRHLQRTHPVQMAQYIAAGGSMPGSTPAKVKPPGPGSAKQSRKSAPPSMQQDDAFAVGPSTTSSSPLAPTLPSLPLLPTLPPNNLPPNLPMLVTPTFGTPLPLNSASPLIPTALSSSLSSSTSSSSAPSASPPSAFCPPGTSFGVPFSDCSLEQLRAQQQHFSNERQWLRYHTPRNLLLALVGEVGELAELFQWREDAEPGLPAWTQPDREAVSEELSDVLLYLVRLSDRCGIDLSAAVQRKLLVNAGKYPAKRARGRSDKYTKLVKEEEGEEEGKEDDVSGISSNSSGSGMAVNGDAALAEGKKQRKKRKVKSTDGATAGIATAPIADHDGKREEEQPAGMDDRKEPEAARV